MQSLHSMQTVLPAADANEPVAQGVHEVAPTAADWPAGHCAQTVFEVGVHAAVGALPPGHVVQATHVDAPAAEAYDVPVTQAVQDVEPEVAEVPAGQISQTVSEVAVHAAVCLYPAPHCLHEAQLEEPVEAA